MRERHFPALLLTVVLTLCVSSQAIALNLGEKGSFAQIQSVLAQEHEAEIARAHFILGKKDLCVKFTINAKGDAYILLQDSSDDGAAHLEIVYGKMVKARAYDPHKSDVLPNGVSKQSNLANLIHIGATRGDGVMLHGAALKKLDDGSEVLNGLMTVMANVTEGDNPAVNDVAAILETSNDDVPRLNKEFVAIHLIYLKTPKAISAP